MADLHLATSVSGSTYCLCCFIVTITIQIIRLIFDINRPVQGVPCLSPSDSWHRLQHYRDPYEDKWLRKWMDGTFFPHFSLSRPQLKAKQFRFYLKVQTKNIP